MTTIVLTPTISASPAGPVIPGQEITTAFELLNSTGTDSAALTLTFTDTNGSEWTLNWTSNTLDAVTLSGSAGPLNAGGTTPYSPPTVAAQISAGKNFIGTITSVVPLTWNSGDYISQIVVSGAGLTAPQTLSASVHVIQDILEINSYLPEEVTQGENIVPLVIEASGGETPYVFSATGLPSGVSIGSSTGIISGVPTFPGQFSTTITVTDAYSETVSTTFEYTVLPSDSVIVPIKTVYANNTMYCPEQQFWTVGNLIPSGIGASINAGTDLTAPIVYTSVDLPLGISLSSSTGFLSGTPVVAQTSKTIVITATDANGIAQSCGFEVVITTNAADAGDNIEGPLFSQQLPTCLARGSAGGLPVQPTIETMFSNSQAAMAAIYPPP